MPSALTETFEALATERDVQRLIDDERAEDLHIEFKRKANRATPKPDRADYAEFSKALSGFANSAGGILLWGVGTTKKDGRDIATDREPIVDYASFAARLQDGLLAAVEPSVDGVRIETIASADPRVGYVKCLVPPSGRIPHRASADHEYYKRSGDDFYKLEHFDIADMFGRPPVPRLKVGLTIVQGGMIGGGGQDKHLGRALLTIRNEGRGSARSPYLSVTLSEAYAFPDGGRITRQHSNSRRFIYAPPDLVIHPGFEHEAPEFRVYTDILRGREIVLPPDLLVEYELGSEHMQPVAGKFVVSGREIAERVLPPNLHEFFFPPA